VPPGIDLAVDNVVEGAAGAPHHQRSDAEQHHIIKIAPLQEAALIGGGAQDQPEDTGQNSSQVPMACPARQLQPGTQGARGMRHPAVATASAGAACDLWASGELWHDKN